ncbi:TetR/AcrR family transcriptional regulator [Nocardia sp. CDC159]|uniref:TetR/AcrR family transcriptional regulator n=1 Tax=Nocardia pulmonis TaxID=2951408 RepID=A0A9X2E8K2_9NOCA|nr:MULTISPECIES: TetR/AcrR family transcriptional regulator [Nocardia]MCM6773701.1 TetR/AcrR family transcriptional regulator [Nocardia pulmonis]MCM6786588.1 TetR/AcrR family transcriptional regulator [Nocardia sp. CDC159]
MAERVDRRSEIVWMAFDQLARRGFEGLRLRQIAGDVGIDHSTLHHHFPGKQDIVAEIARYAIGRFGVAPPEGAGAAECLRGYLNHLRELLASSPEVFVVTAELDLRARRDPAVREIMARHEENRRDRLREVLAAGVAEGAWSARVDPVDAAELVIATVKGLQLAPDTAAAALAQLEALLAR